MILFIRKTESTFQWLLSPTRTQTHTCTHQPECLREHGPAATEEEKRHTLKMLRLFLSEELPVSFSYISLYTTVTSQSSVGDMGALLAF